MEKGQQHKLVAYAIAYMLADREIVSFFPGIRRDKLIQGINEIERRAACGMLENHQQDFLALALMSSGYMEAGQDWPYKIHTALQDFRRDLFDNQDPEPAGRWHMPDDQEMAK